MNDTQNIQWFPGHMAKTKRLIKEKLPLIDLVAEILDARIPISSRNPDLDGLFASKPRLIILNKSDMADQSVTDLWIEAFRKQQILALPVNCKNGTGMTAVLPAVKTILADRLEHLKNKGMGGRTLRVMAVGIPNAGKSSFINCLAGRSRAKVENRPGVTRGNQWFMVDKGVELMDTPGVLWPKFEDELVAERLAFTGAVKDTVMDIELLAVRLLDFLKTAYVGLLKERYKLDDLALDLPSYELLEEIGRKRGMLAARGEIDAMRVSAILLEEFRNCKIGRVSLEKPQA